MDVRQVIETLKDEMIGKGRFLFRDIQDIGKDLMVTCPFHGDGNESTPSFGITKEDKVTSRGTISAGTCNCFACGAKMSLPKLVSLVREEEEIDSSEWLVNTFGFTESKNMIDGIDPIMVGGELTLNPSKYLNPDLPYLRTRGIERRTAVEFQLGYDKQYNTLVIPVFDKNGTCRMMIQRNIDTKRFYNTSGSDKEELLFGLDKAYKFYEHLMRKKKVYVVESAIDAMRLWQVGIPALATMQATPTQGQIKQLKRVIELFSISTLVIATDNDEAGEKAIGDYVDNFRTMLTLERLVFPPNTKDVGDMQDSDIVKQHTMLLGGKHETKVPVEHELRRIQKIH